MESGMQLQHVRNAQGKHTSVGARAAHAQRNTQMVWLYPDPENCDDEDSYDECPL